MSEPRNNAPAKAKQSTIAYRLVAAIIAAACVVALFLPFTLYKGSPSNWIPYKTSMIALFEQVADAPYKLFGFIPMPTNPKSTLGFGVGLVAYGMAAGLAAAFLLALAGVFFGKKSKKFAFLATMIFTWGVALYMIAMISITCYLPVKIAFDPSIIILAGFGALAFLVLMFAKLGKKLCILNSVRFLLTLAFTICFFLAITFNFDLVGAFIAEKKLYKIALVVAIVLTVINVVFATVRAYKEKAFSFDFINSVAELVIAGALIILSVTSDVTDKAFLLLSGICAGIAVILFILTFIGVKVAQRRAATTEYDDEPVAEGPVAAPVAEKKPAQTTTTSATPSEPAATFVPAEAAMEDYFAGKQIDKF
ncbi:MAG: hypothetical protein IJD33_03695, partial [Clostridia bacterium]|nr:hypothetical protein [Clostridia bacterium]